MQEPG